MQDSWCKRGIESKSTLLELLGMVFITEDLAYWKLSKGLQEWEMKLQEWGKHWHRKPILLLWERHEVEDELCDWVELCCEMNGLLFFFFKKSEQRNITHLVLYQSPEASSLKGPARYKMS